MIIDTKDQASTLWRTKNFALIIYILSAGGVIAFLPVDLTFRFVICGALSLAFLLFYWYQYNMRFTYFYFSNNSKNLIFKFYSLRNFHGKPRTIEIPKSSFVKFEIIRDFFDKRESLILYQKTTKGLAKYPPISLTLVSIKQRTELTGALHSIINS